MKVVCGADEEDLKNIRNFRAFGKLEYLRLLWKGPKNAPVTQSLGEMKGVLNKIKEIGAEIDSIFPECKSSKTLEMKFDCKDALDFVNKYSILNEARRGEYPSYLIHSNA